VNVDLYLTTSGRRITPKFPLDLTPWPELSKAVESARRLEREFQESCAAHLAADTALQAAIAQDRERLAEARLQARKKLPDAKGIDAAKAALDEAERQRNAADDARRRAAEIVLETLEEHRAEYVRVAEEAVERAHLNEADALTAYLESVEQSTRTRETYAWIRDFPEKRGHQPNTTPLRYVGRLEPIPFSDLVYGLKVRCGLADPPRHTFVGRARV
jgi:hypothetical protein